MKERPIIFSGPMVRAILEGRKTQTRRPVRGVDECPHGYDGVVTATVAKEAHLRGKHCFALASGESLYLNCPYGTPGARLWVREAWRPTGVCAGQWTSVLYRADDTQLDRPYFFPNLARGGWRPSIHMPRSACRLMLEVTKVRVERLGDLTEKDARGEGIFRAPWSSGRGHGWTSDEGQPVSTTAVRAFEDLWHSIHGSWLPDTWVWVVDFRREK